mmetsp:Transcript_39309/g.60051  ORF Transcript_39309/g.60051 Transcript_39309/m.60051 type:complete len:194 (-) Transcript_39309:453-1034(-)
MLKGNRFSVALRFIDKSISDEQIAENVKSAIDNGFVNYFGMQRFGTYTVRTHTIGKEILRHNWENAIKLILVQTPDYLKDVREERKELITSLFGLGAPSSQDFHEALASLTPRDRLEKIILHKLTNAPNDYYNAFAAISRHTRFIYIHAYQSYVWNRTVSERLRRFGTKVLVGDQVAKTEDMQEQEPEGSEDE